MRLFQLILSIFFLGFLTNLIFWQHHEFFDKSEWIKEATYFYTNPLDTNGRLFYGYPATPFLVLGSVFHRVGLPWESALTVSLSTLIAVGVTSVVVVCYLLRPDSMWYIGAAAIALFHPLYQASTPPSAIVAPFVALLILWAVYVYERSTQPTFAAIIFGCLAGFAAAIRLDITVAISGLLLLFLLPRLKSFVLIAIFSALLVFSLANPYMWFMPVQHLVDIWHKLTTHFYTFDTALSLLTLLRISSLALLSMFLALLTPTLPKRFVLALLVTTVVLVVAILQSSYQPRWYFYPLILSWEIFLPLFVLETFKGRPIFKTIFLAVLIFSYSVLS